MLRYPPTRRTNIPPFNPFKLYGSGQPSELGEDADENAGSGLSRSDVSTKVVELLGGILPEEDGQELDAQEVQDIVERGADTGGDVVGDGSGAPLDGVAASGPAIPAQGADPSWQPKAATTDNLNTTDIFKSTEAPDEPSDDLEGGQVIVVTVGPQDTLAKILAKAGAPEWDVHSMIEAGHSIFSENALVPGQEVRITLIPSLSDPKKMEPARYSIFSDGHDHLVTVSRSAAGEFVGSAQPPFEEELQHVANSDEDPQNVSLYASVYLAGLTQSLAPETIAQILSINAFDTDFRRRVRPGDTLEMFFDMKDDQSTDGPPGQLLYTAISSGGAVYKFYRFRSADGVVDYYDEDGNNSKKFLIRKPVRGDDVRLTSGFGVRFHPLLNTRKMHTGVDWACAQGTPIIAAGNGTIEEVGTQGLLRQLHPHPSRQRLPNGVWTHEPLRQCPGRHESPAGSGHRLRRFDRLVVRPARALRGAGQQPLRRPDVDPSPARTKARRQGPGRIREGALPHRRADAPRARNDSK